MTFAQKIQNLLKEAPEPGTLPDKGHMPVPFAVGECHFNLSPEQRASATYEDVDLHGLIATQRTVDAARVQELMNTDDAETGDPVLVRSEGKLYIADGHHRLTRDFLKGIGRQSVKVVTEDVELVGKIDKTDIEAAAKEVHDRWMENQKKKGHDSHKSPDGKEEYMVGYDELSEPAKKLDRDAVHAVLDALKEDAFTDALSKFTGMKFDACPKCGELLAHRKGEVLPCTKCNPKPLKEDGMAVGGGGVAGIGVGPDGQPPVSDADKKFAEPGVSVRKKLQPEEDKFAGADVFKVDMDKVMSSRYGPKNRYHRYAKYIGNDEDAEDIRVHARSNRNDVVLQDKSTGVMQYLRRRMK